MLEKARYDGAPTDDLDFPFALIKFNKKTLAFEQDAEYTMGMQRTKEDFGQTLGKWGVQSGPYLVLPFLGPSSPRDAVGMGTDLAINPLNYPEFESDDEIRLGVAALGGINAREGAIEAIDEVRNQIDPYTTVRRLYDRTRQQDIANAPVQPKETEKVPESELDF